MGAGSTREEHLPDSNPPVAGVSRNHRKMQILEDYLRRNLYIA
jgi:hypothetical protein